MEYISKKVAAYGQFVLVLVQNYISATQPNILLLVSIKLT